MVHEMVVKSILVGKMKNIKNTIFYISTIGVFSYLMYWIVQRGKILESGREIHVSTGNTSHWSEFVDFFTTNIHHPLSILLAQIITIVVVARILGWICRKIGQPTVIGEIIAGILLGPSLVGSLLPGFSDALFPDSSLGNLQFLSQIGLILFMFMVGMELDLKTLKNKAREAVLISHASIIIPFALGMILAYYIYENFAPSNVQFLSFALFIGIAMSITAFPVLARIVHERGIHKTRLGAIVITCAAVDDITAWSLLAAVIAIVKAGTFVSSLYTIAIALGYVFLMIKVVRPFLKRVGDLYPSRQNMGKQVVAIYFLVLILSSFATEVIGIHALFGAFMAGTIMPEDRKIRNIFIEKVEDIALVLLLPLFFVFTGLRTEIGLINDPYLWKITGLIILVAVAGKFAGSAFAAKFVGQDWRNSLSIGALMNTRGLMELVVLNIGYDLGVLSPEIFSMMVIMALVTTFMTGPALDLIEKTFKIKKDFVSEEINLLRKFKILLSFGNPQMGRSLLQLAHTLIKKQQDNASVTVLHLGPNSVLHHYNIEEYENESFEPIIQESQDLDQKITTLFKASDDIDTDITEITNKGNFDLLLIGIGQSIFEGTLLGRILGYTTSIVNPDRLLKQVSGKGKAYLNSPFDDRTQNILSGSKVRVGIFIDKNSEGWDHIIVPFYSEKDGFMMEYIQRFIRNSEAQVTVTDPMGVIRNNAEVKEAIRAIEQEAPNHITLSNGINMDEQLIRQFQLMVISTEGWKKLIDSRTDWLDKTPSILILRE
ncbi:MAG TPA: cation:proton antiporter [Prolixibacteraceae bacterium]|nr:cation:proton antiporter [Prolixibacteraceae bacterium]